MSLVKNINARKKAGTSRPKSKSTVSPKAYKAMKSGWKNTKKRGQYGTILTSGKGVEDEADTSQTLLGGKKV